MIEQRGGSILESYHLFDLYEGAQIKEGHKSVAYSIVFRAKDRTLEDADVTKAMKKILNGRGKYGNRAETVKEGKFGPMMKKRKIFILKLPEELIAQDPLEDRSASRLLVLDKSPGRSNIECSGISKHI